MEEVIEKEWKLIDNSIFPDDEDGIEHIDDSYEGFKTRIIMALGRMYIAGRKKGIEKYGTTPEEAVKNLWLALNKK